MKVIIFGAATGGKEAAKRFMGGGSIFCSL